MCVENRTIAALVKSEEKQRQCAKEEVGRCVGVKSEIKRVTKDVCLYF